MGHVPSNSALTSLRSIGGDSGLYLANGASLTTTPALTNNGEVSVSGGQFGSGTSLTIGGALTNTEFLVVNGGLGTSATLNVEGTFTNTNYTPTVTGGQDGNAFLNVSGALINSGNLYFQGGYAGAATLNTAAAVTISSTGSIILDGSNYTATGNAVWELTGPTLSNSGAIDLNGGVADATLEIGANVTTSGSGAIYLSNTSTNLITGTSPSFTLTNGSTIEGSGTISNMGIVNKGTISANQSTPLLILPSSLGLNNKGTLSVLAGDTMQIGTSAGGALTNLLGTTLTGGTYSVGGTMQFGASTASIVTDAANIALTGAGAQMINFDTCPDAPNSCFVVLELFYRRYAGNSVPDGEQAFRGPVRRQFGQFRLAGEDIEGRGRRGGGRLGRVERYDLILFVDGKGRHGLISCMPRSARS